MGGHATRKREINIAEYIFVGKAKGKKPHRIVICISKLTYAVDL
jgi:hypothetical protein